MDIAIFTTTRADFGILAPFIKELNKEDNISVLLFVGGSHIDNSYGNTINEIKDNGFEITQTFDFLLNENDAFSLAKSISIESLELAYIFNEFFFDAVCILGDRYELLPIVNMAILYKKPIIHIHGGEKSEGAVDEQIRHMISKASHIHFTACDEYKLNLIKMGEEEFRVHNTGALAVDNMKTIDLLSKNKLFQELRLNENKKTIILTYHPVTLELNISATQQLENIFLALKEFHFQVVITAPNSDAERDKIEKYILQQTKMNEDYIYIESLGAKLFHNLIFYSEFIIGNSSSGIIEVPYFKKPTVNIGIRQKGRLQHQSIINTDYSVDSIKKGIEKALNKQFQKSLINIEYLFGDGNSAKKMVSIIKTIKFDENLLRKQLSFR